MKDNIHLNIFSASLLKRMQFLVHSNILTYRTSCAYLASLSYKQIDHLCVSKRRGEFLYS